MGECIIWFIFECKNILYLHIQPDRFKGLIVGFGWAGSAPRIGTLSLSNFSVKQYE